jgi:hypothetical protein
VGGVELLSQRAEETVIDIIALAVCFPVIEGLNKRPLLSPLFAEAEEELEGLCDRGERRIVAPLRVTKRGP